MSNIGRWFLKRHAERIRNKLKQHSKLVVKTVGELDSLLRVWVTEGRVDEKIFVRLKNHEKEADNLRRDVLRMLAEIDIEPDVKSYLARVVRRIDFVADWALEAARLVQVVGPEKFSSELRDAVIKMSDKMKATAAGMVESIEYMFVDAFKTLELCDKVERIEEEVDSLYQYAREVFKKDFENRSTTVAILVFRVLDAVENVVDQCENTCDSVREFIVRGALTP